MARTYSIITNHTNGAGLQRDGELLERMLVAAGHKVIKLQFNDYACPVPPVDVAIFLEVINGRFLDKAAQTWFVPNSEWFYPSWNGVLATFTKVLCKTDHCLKIFNKLAAGRSHYLGFEAEDLYRPDIPRQRKFLHTAGKSETKNTKVVMDAWRKYNIPYPITVSAFKPEIRKYCENVPNLTLVERLTQDELVTAVNSHQFMIMPSKQEGFGHALHEAAGCGTTVITVGQEPMSTFGVDKRLLIPSSGSFQMRAALAYEVTPEGVRDAVERAVALPQQELDTIGNNARTWFHKDREQFRANFARLVQ